MTILREKGQEKREKGLTDGQCHALLSLALMSAEEIAALVSDQPAMRVTLAWLEGAGDTATRCTATIRVRTPEQAVRTVRREFRVSPETRVIIKRIMPLNAGLPAEALAKEGGDL